MIEPIFNAPNLQADSLRIDRDTGTIALSGTWLSVQEETVLVIYGIIGFVRVNAGDVLIVATNISRVAKIGTDDIYQITQHKIIPVYKSTLHISDEKTKDDATYIQILEQFLSSGKFYFSHSMDLTNSLQRQAQLHGDGRSMWQKVDERFFWNQNVCKRLIEKSYDYSDNNMSNFILPIIYGYIEFKQLTINNSEIVFGLISRRSQFRAGTRLNSRGLDDDGNVSNFVETEQIVYHVETGNRVSYVQTRGSIPVFWSQYANVKYAPKPVVDPKSITFEKFCKHITEQHIKYGDVIAVNLVNKKGSELMLSKEFEKYVNAMADPKLRYVHFDFHHECRNMQWDRISLLVGQLEKDLLQQGYCCVDRLFTVLRTQTSVIRTNCMDCLDRTNVVQTVFARRVLTAQLIDLNITGATQSVDNIPDLSDIFRNIWANNADEMALQYAGSGAMKTDFTRTGKRSWNGIMDDGYNASIRYAKNNYADGWRQDGYDLFLGRYEVNPQDPSPFARPFNSLMIAIPVFIIFNIFMAIVTILRDPSKKTPVISPYFLKIKTSSKTNIFQKTGLFSFHFLTILFWILLAILGFRVLLQYGYEFVSRPHLVPLPTEVQPSVSEAVMKALNLSSLSRKSRFGGFGGGVFEKVKEFGVKVGSRVSGFGGSKVKNKHDA
ncbi:Phosphatidylinositide phosphatase SAC1 [Nowakowskiella sp. JEL0407]|nr:Phosphatidylinositide phosphatase SAC1 [Nowakowskiella sp. JEL0407]